MKKLAQVYLLLTGLCAFLHYPLSVVSPYGIESSFSLVFKYEFPHIFVASVLSLCYIFLSFGKLDFKSNLVRAVSGALGLICLSGLIYQVPFYRIIELGAYFTVPLGIGLAVKDAESNKILVYVISSVFIINLAFCLFLPGNKMIGIAGNRNWLAASLLAGLPFILFLIYKYLNRYFYIISGIVIILTAIVFVRTSARALIPAMAVFGLFVLYRKQPLKVNVAVWAGMLVFGLVVILMNQDKVQRGLAQDIRGPLSADTLSLIASTPLLGTGPGNFQRDFPEYASDTLKKRIYYSSIVEHPHNELLNMAASAGVPVALLWLFLIYSLLKKNDDEGDLFWKFAVLATFMMGMADKPLTESPSAIIFLIACGLLVKWNEVSKEESNDRLYKAGAVIALCTLIFGIYRTQIDVRSRYHFWRGEDLRSRMNSMNRSQIAGDILREYRLSSEIDPTFITAAYNAVSFSLYFFNNLSLDQQLLEHMISLEPDYSDFNLKIAQYYMKQARLLGVGEERTLTEKEAEKYFLRNYELSPYNINRCRWLVRFYIETKDFEKAEQWILKCREIARQRMKARYTHTDRIDYIKDTFLWQEQILSGSDNPITFLGGLKANEAPDYWRHSIFERTNFVMDFTTRRNPELDRDFWRRRLEINRIMKEEGIDSTRKILDHLAGIEYRQAGMQWPLTVLEKRTGNARSLASLACSMNSLLNKESVLLVSKGSEVILCVLFDGNDEYIWNCKSGVLLKTNLKDFHENSQLRSEIAGREIDDYEYELFCYPESFALRNQAIADAVSINPAIPVFCQSPSLHMIRLKRRIGQKEVRFANKHIGLLDSMAGSIK